MERSFGQKIEKMFHKGILSIFSGVAPLEAIMHMSEKKGEREKEGEYITPLLEGL